MLVEGTNRRIYNIDKKIGMAIAGRIPDGRHIVQYARTESDKYEKEFDLPIKGGRVLINLTVGSGRETWSLSELLHIVRFSPCLRLF